MCRDLEPVSLQPISLGKSKNHHTGERAKTQQVEIGEISDQPHGGTMRCGKGITDKVELVTMSINFN